MEINIKETFKMELKRDKIVNINGKTMIIIGIIKEDFQIIIFLGKAALFLKMVMKFEGTLLKEKYKMLI